MYDQSSQWKRPEEPKSKKARQVHSNVQVLLTVFFDCNGVVHHEFLGQGRTVNKEYYLEVMHRSREAIRQKLTELWKSQSWILHHDNAPAQTSMLVSEFLAKNKTVIMPQPSYSSDLERNRNVSRIGKNAGISALYLRLLKNNGYFLITPCMFRNH